MDGQELRKRRNQLGLTQRGLARLLRVTEGSVYLWEKDLRTFPLEKQDAFKEIEVRLSNCRSIKKPK